MNNNKFTQIDQSLFEFNNNLKEIYLEENQLENIDKNGFKNKTNLLILSLAFNKLKTIDAVLFEDLKNLKELYLNNNFLDQLCNFFKKLHNLETLWLHNNNLVILIY